MNISDIEGIYNWTKMIWDFNDNNSFDYTDVNFSWWKIRKMINHGIYDHLPFQKSKAISKIALGNARTFHDEEFYYGKQEKPDILVWDDSKWIENVLPWQRGIEALWEKRSIS